MAVFGAFRHCSKHHLYLVAIREHFPLTKIEGESFYSQDLRGPVLTISADCLIREIQDKTIRSDTRVQAAV